MANAIAPKRSFTVNSVPQTTDVAMDGELLINWADGKLFTRQNGQIVTLNVGSGSGGGGGGSGGGVKLAVLLALQ